MKPCDSLSGLPRHPKLIVMDAGVPLVPRQIARDTSDLYWLSARSARADAQGYKSIFTSSGSAHASATDQCELVIGQCHRVLRFVLFDIMFYLYRLHVVHLGRMTDRFVRKNSLSDPGGGAVKKFFNARCLSAI